MTTIVVGFDLNGVEVVATDKMASRTNISDEHEFCKQCDEETSVYVLVDKIHMPKTPILFHKSPIQYVVGAGRSHLIERIRKLLFAGEDVFKVWKNSHTLTGNHPIGTASLFVRTEEMLWELTFNGHKTEEKKHPTTTYPVYLGSGVPAARLYMALNPTGQPHEAVIAAHFGDVFSRDCDVFAPFVKDYVVPPMPTTIEALRKTLQTGIRKATPKRTPV